MAVVERSTLLVASADAVWAAVKTPAAFRKVTRGLFVMPVIRGRQDQWCEGETVVGWVFLFGLLPFSRHHMHIASIDATTCRYRDQIEIEAGIRTPLIVLYATWFYWMRQRRRRAKANVLN